MDDEINFSSIPEQVPQFQTVVMVHILALYPFAYAGTLLREARLHTAYGGTLWIIERDTRRQMRRYGEGVISTEDLNSGLFPGPGAEDSILSVWDAGLLTQALEAAGFVDAKPASDLDFPLGDIQDDLTLLASGVRPAP